MKSIAAIVAGAAVVLSVSACSSKPPTFEECAKAHAEALQSFVTNGTPVDLEKLGCGQWYQDELKRRAGVTAPVTQPSSITPSVTPS